MNKKLGKEFAIGLSVILAVLILIVGIDYLKGINLFKPANFYEVYYDNVAGLDISAPVTINGYKVGQVREISMDYKKPGKVKVVLALNKNLHLTEGTTAQLGSTLLSGAFINIKMGEGKKLLPVGSTLDAFEGKDLMAAISDDVMPAVNNILPKVDSLLSNLNTLVSDPALAQSINRLDGITGNIYAVSGSLNSSMGQFNRQFPAILGNANYAVIRLDTITENLAALSSDLRRLPLQPTMENVHRITANLEQFSNSLNDRNSTLGKLTSDPALYNQLHKVSADIDSLIIDIKRNPKRYISIKLL